MWPFLDIAVLGSVFPTSGYLRPGHTCQNSEGKSPLYLFITVMLLQELKGRMVSFGLASIKGTKN